MNLDASFKLHSSCFLTRGTTRSLIVDTERQKYYLIPNLLYEILVSSEIKCFADAIDLYAGSDEYNKGVLFGYFKFLMDKDLIMWSEGLLNYSSLIKEYFYPGYISNAIVDVNSDSFNNVYVFLSQVDEIMCRSLQLRFFCKVNCEYLHDIAIKYSNSLLEWVEYYMPFDESLDLAALMELCLKNPRLRLIVLYGFETDGVIWQRPAGGSRIVGIREYSNSHRHCGVVNPAYFATSLVAISESSNFNSCLNRKLGIDENGFIKNCPSQDTNYGNIADTRLIEAVRTPEFRKIWGVNKQVVKVCMDCEFRDICTDCRVYLEDPYDENSKPLKCGYDPYTGNWVDWRVNPLKSDAIEYYNLDKI